MIIREMIFKDMKDANPEFVKTYSDKGLLIRKLNTSEIFVEAIDKIESGFLYEETNLKFIFDENTQTEYLTEVEN